MEEKCGRSGAPALLTGLIAVFLLSPGCGKGGGGASPAAGPAAVPAGSAANSIEGVLWAVNLAMSSWEAPEAGARPPGAGAAGGGRFAPRTRAGGGEAAGDLSPLLCPDGGSASSDGETTTFSVCIDRFLTEVEGEEVEVRETSEGAQSFRSSATSFSTLLRGLSRRSTRVLDGRLLEESRRDLGVEGKLGPATLECRGASSPRSAAIVVEGSLEKRRDDDLDGALDLDETRTFSRLEVRATVSDPDPETCLPRRIEIDLTGGFARVDRLRARCAVRASVPAGKPLRIVLSQVDGGMRLSVEGSLMVEGSCGGSTQLSTEEELLIPEFEPGDEPAECPTAGLLRVEAGKRLARIRYTASGGVEIDDGADGSVDRSYPDCHRVESCPE